MMGRGKAELPDRAHAVRRKRRDAGRRGGDACGGAGGTLQDTRDGNPASVSPMPKDGIDRPPGAWPHRRPPPGLTEKARRILPTPGAG